MYSAHWFRGDGAKGFCFLPPSWVLSRDFRKNWLMILMIVTSSRSNINIRRFEKATGSTGKEGLLSEGNAAYNWCRCVDELESQFSKHGSLKKLYFNHQHLTETQGMRQDKTLIWENNPPMGKVAKAIPGIALTGSNNGKGT
ncbi:protein nap1 [Quercus suber]|uniref:Protein nap1 n=1 Tax=Quercus suber TaxID=58331 RepID=A0AAW0JZA8_QUESU